MEVLLTALATIILAMAALPLGLLPSILAFRDLADGKDGGPNSEHAYAVTLWAGLAISTAIGAVAGAFIASHLFS